ncbi:uncharacterized protein I303_108511 [Kwoniella dejecticola CBS 10117]|uniref:assimilatory sulfite reductase (NADPH) n=1 Tax=Kwoniella dejecticola CBS 10117 TaxID=1296121 RepID=A0A1A5ZX74_9TREE|nr:sulfite reductase (NADPH) flavoprotein alpha-component [Kwoniella dejecticola CBS 10117]OBR82406.1 sulfite reductase (NADPH) flavoprotein alpha-component [Kwoniella dejecticola CBS 10117]
MAPVVLTSSLTSAPGVPAGKSQIATMKADAGLNLDADGSSTPYSSSSTAVSEDGGKSPDAKSIQKALVDASLPDASPSPTDSGYYSHLLASSLPTIHTKSGSTVFASGVEVLEAFAVKHSESVWVYDDAIQVGFGARLSELAGNKVHELQTREGAGLELAGYSTKSSGRFSVFASVKTLPHLLPSLERINGDVVIHLSTTTIDENLEFTDGLYSAGVLKDLLSVPEGWEVVFSSSGTGLLETTAKLYGSEARKVIHVVSSTLDSREATSYTFPSPSDAPIPSTKSFDLAASQIYVVPVGKLARSIYQNLPAGSTLFEFKTLSPSSEEVYNALTSAEGAERKTVSVLGGSKADAEALKALTLSALYSASGSSKSVLPTVKSVVASTYTDVVTAKEASVPGKVISFFTSPLSPLPQLLSHLFLSSPSLETRLAQFGSSAARGVKSVLSLAPSGAANQNLAVDQASDVTWINDANVIKSTDVLSSAKDGSIVVLELPWSEEEVAVKLSRSEILTIKSKNLRVFLLDLSASPVLPIQEQVAFLLLYTGTQRLSAGVWKVLDAFHSHQLNRDDVEVAQAALTEVRPADWEVPELEEGKTEKVKSAWEWDALPGTAGIVDVLADEKPINSTWELAARHLFFREAFAVPDAKVVDAEESANIPGINGLRPSMADETFLVTVSENRRLTPATYDRNVFHLELDTAGTGLKYEIGEAIGIHGWNDTQEVLDFCSWYGVQPDDLVTFANPLKAGTNETRTIFQLLQQNVDLFGRPGKAFYAALSKTAKAKADAMALKFISAPEGAELFQKMAEKETVTFADVLFRYKTARPSIGELIGMIPEIKPRHYSIASSQKAVGDKVELLIVTVDWTDSHGSPRFGQCTRYLAALAPGAKVTVSIKPSVMKLPPDNKQPIIMAGLGTGAAPFRAFMQHRAWQRTQGIDVGPLIYYFGSRYRSQEYLYGEEIEAYIKSGIISHAGLAFSRDSDSKTYIQHKMSADKKMLSKLLQGEGSDAAYFYLCGPTWPVPDVFEALVGSLTDDGMERKRAEEYIEELKEDERYVLEVY